MDIASFVAGLEAGVGNSGSVVLDSILDRSITELASNATSIGDYALYYCKALTIVYLPEATSIGSRAFYGCSALTTVNFPKITTLENSAFSGCSLLTTAYFQKADCIKQYAFKDCFSLRSVILGSTSVCTLENRGALTNCYHFFGSVNPTYNPNGDKDGYIYVPSALVESYKVASVWSDFSDRFRALEDYTVDGTITGELDPNKI